MWLVWRSGIEGEGGGVDLLVSEAPGGMVFPAAQEAVARKIIDSRQTPMIKERPILLMILRTHGCNL